MLIKGCPLSGAQLCAWFLAPGCLNRASSGSIGRGREPEIVQTDQSKVNGRFCYRLPFQLFVTFSKVHALEIIIFGHFFHIWLWPRAMSFGKIEAKIPSAVCEPCKHPSEKKKSKINPFQLEEITTELCFLFQLK